MKPIIIADIGSNHRNSLELAYKQIEAAKDCGCDVAKFQLYTHQELYGFASHLDYELPHAWLPKLKEHCDKVQIEFMCTAFSPSGVKLVNDYVGRHKIASAEMMHEGILEAVLKTGKKVILSLGGATQEDIEEIIDIIWSNKALGRLTLLECVAAYPALASAYNLHSLANLKGAHERPGSRSIGISDHTLTNTAALVALGCGARVFEKHFDSEGTGASETPDSGHSIGKEAMLDYVKQIQLGFEALRNRPKSPTASELGFVKVTRRLMGQDTFRGKN